MSGRAWRWSALGLALVGLVFAADVATGSDYAFSLFYLVPIGLVTWRAGRGPGAVASVVSAGAWLVASLWTGAESTHPQVLVWNTAMQAGFFLVVVWALAAVRRGLERERLLADRLARSYRSLDREMTIVGDLQRAMLPTASPDLPGYSFAAYYAASTRAGGDYYDFFPLRDGRLGILIADVSGHGAPAAVVMAMLRVLLHVDAGALDSPSRVLLDANRRLAANIPPGQFVTACYAVLEPRTGELEYAIAGHEAPLIVRADGSGIESFAHPSGPPMGPFPDAAFGAARAKLAPGDLVLFSTDGLCEAMDAEGRLLGAERVRELLAAARGESAEAVRDRLVEAVVDHGGGRERADDLTLLVLRRALRPVASPHEPAPAETAGSLAGRGART
ncbi:MAG: PP2C family protein-serine/threonine phosphatase [Candidatus Eisenbacteria bacterium]